MNPVAMPKPYGYVEAELTLEEYFRRLQVEEPELSSYAPELDKPRDKQVGGKHYHQGKVFSLGILSNLGSLTSGKEMW